MGDTQYSTDGGATYSSTLINGVITQSKVFAIGGSALTNVILGSGVTSIGSSAFANCSNLTTVNISSSVTSIGILVFFNCINLTTVTIPSSVTSIGDSAFFNCTSLTTVTIPDSVTSIGDSAFYNCTSLTTMTFEGPLTFSNIVANLFFAVGSNSTRTFYFNNTNTESQINTTLLSSIKNITDNDIVSVTGPQIFIVPTITTVITVNSFNKTYGDSPFYLNPSSNSFAPFSYSSNNTQVATVVADTGLVTLVGVGTAVITVSQPETTGYTSGTATSTFEVTASTPNNPVIINDGPEFEYLLTTNAPYGSLTNDITVVDNLTNDGNVVKTITNSTNQPINIVK